MKNQFFTLIRWIVGFAAILLTVLSANPGGQEADYDPDFKYSPEKLKKDFGIFRTALEEAHGALYRYTPKDSMDRLFHSVDSQWIKPMAGREGCGFGAGTEISPQF